MKKLLIFGSVISIAFGAVIVPSIMVMQGFVKSLEKYAPEIGEDEEKEVTENVHDSNQGFEDVSTLNLKTSLGEVEELNTDFLINKIKKLNPVLADFTLYIKGLTLSKIKFTVENYTGTVTADFHIKDLKSLIKNTDLGNLKNIEESTIFNKIKEINPSLPKELDFEGEVKPKVKSLSNIKLEWINNSKGSDLFSEKSTREFDEIDLTYKPMSLRGLLQSLELGTTQDISINFISKRLIELNSVPKRDASFLGDDDLYRFVFADPSKQTSNNALISLQTRENSSSFNFETYKFSEVEGDNIVSVTYIVNNISTLITNRNLGEIANFDPETVLKRVLELNPLYKSYRGSDSLSNSIVKVTSIRNASIQNISLSGGTIPLTFQVTDISKLITNTSLGDISEYIETDTSKILQKIKEKNPKLAELKVSDKNIIIGKRTIPSFGPTDQYIKDVKFDLKIANSDFDATIEMKFNIKRASLEKALKAIRGLENLDLGNLTWTTPETILNAIKSKMYDSSGNQIELEKHVIYGNPTYDYVDLSSKTDSLLYFGDAKITYTTNFKRTKDFNIQGTNGSSGTNSFTSTQTIPESSVVNQKTEAPDAYFTAKYAIPLSFSYAKSKNKKFFINLSYNSENVKSNYIGNTYPGSSGRSDDKLKFSLSDIENGKYNNNSKFDNKQITVNYRTRYWGKCTDRSQTVDYMTDFYYSLAKSNEGGTDYIVVMITLKTKTNDYSTCDDIGGNWKIIINSMELI